MDRATGNAGDETPVRPIVVPPRTLFTYSDHVFDEAVPRFSFMLADIPCDCCSLIHSRFRMWPHVLLEGSSWQCTTEPSTDHAPSFQQESFSPYTS